MSIDLFHQKKKITIPISAGSAVMRFYQHRHTGVHASRGEKDQAQRKRIHPYFLHDLPVGNIHHAIVRRYTQFIARAVVVKIEIFNFRYVQIRTEREYYQNISDDEIYKGAMDGGHFKSQG